MQGEECQATAGAETGECWPQAKDCQGRQASTRSTGGKASLPCRLQKEHSPTDLGFGLSASRAETEHSSIARILPLQGCLTPPQLPPCPGPSLQAASCPTVRSFRQLSTTPTLPPIWSP